MEAPRTLGAFPYRRVVIVCPWCRERRGSYDTERLIARLGPGASLEDVLLALVAYRWPNAWNKRGPSPYVPWCRARYADLGSRRPGLMEQMHH
ncbi:MULTISPECIES: hypothetical protein [Methylobacterium]|uniref:Uncharacterized protein n=2 Tax=Methylobacterium TaxID=407 RepID=A0A0C6F011_9HYPH|nr:hypothetical protein [Methylobacterium aquaticum]QRE77149.1 hypothetical protein F1D61_29670 [Methylobacterium aquaticum]BAQ45876.1 hypothetical protein Maq22A_c13275 [Methylobacterium aquaticum]